MQGHFPRATYPLYVRREITRPNVRDLVRKGLDEARWNYEIVARLLNREPMKEFFDDCGLALLFCLLLSATSAAQTPADAGTAAARPPSAVVPLPAGYVIGPEDTISVVFWRDRDMSADVVVRPDGKISLPLLNDVQAAGYTPEQLGAALQKTASKYVTDPNVTVVVKDIKSRKVYVIGEVAKPGAIALGGEMTVLQAIAVVGGLLEYANKQHIVVVRQENGREVRLKFNYSDVVKGKKIEQNVQLKPGDTILVR